MVIKDCYKPVFISTIICICFFYINKNSIQAKEQLRSLINSNQITGICGTFISSPSKSPESNFYTGIFKVNKAYSNKNIISDATGIITVYIPEKIAEAYLPGKLYSQAVKYGSYLYEKGGNYTFSGKIINDKFICSSCMNMYWSSSIKGKINFFRAICRLYFKRFMYGWGKAGGLLLGLLCGSREYIDSEISQAFRNAGLSHILALSGMHLSVFSGITIFFISKFKNNMLNLIIRFFVITVFAWFADLSPSLLRAYIFTCLILLQALIFNKKNTMQSILCFSFLIQSIIRTRDIYNLGFILSYGALLGIIVFSDYFKAITSKIFPSLISNSLSASMGAQVFTIPISLICFKNFSPVGILATLVLTPLITLFIYAGILGIILVLIFPYLISSSGIFMNFLYTIIVRIVKIFSLFPRIQF